jgi:hypothetical protein
LLGVANNGQRVRLLIDVDRAISKQELDSLSAEPAA